MAVASSFFLWAAGLIFAGIISLLIFSRFKISDVAILMLLGILVGQVFHLVDKADFEPYMAVVGSFTLAMVLFNEGLNLSAKELQDLGPQVLIFSLFVYVIATSLITGVVYFLDPQHNLFQSLIIGIALGASGPSVVLPILHGVSLVERVRKFLVMEVIIADTVAILLVTALLILRIKDIGEFTSDIVSKMLNTAALSIFVGIVAGVLWVGVLSYYKQKFDYLLALGTMLLSYSVATFLNSNGILAVFTLALVMGNVGSSRLNHLRLMHDEFTFLIKTFFFIYLGILFNFSYFSIGLVLTAIAIVAPMLIARYAGVFLFRIGDSVVRPITTLVIGRGVGVAIMVILITTSGLVSFPSFVEISFLVIFITCILSTIGVYLYEKRAGQINKIHVGTVQATLVDRGESTGL